VTRAALRQHTLRQLDITLDALEGWREVHLRAHPQLAVGLAALPEAWEGLHALCVRLQSALLTEGEGAEAK
jgi:hypothetical protein